MSYEFYSAQTRQVKTAMVLSSATLLLYTIAGRPVNDFIKIPPGQFEIPADLLIYLFFLSALYFSASFFVSANYDKKFSEMPELAKEIDLVIKSIRSWKNSVDSSVSGQFAEIRNYSRNMLRKLTILTLNICAT